ncbi:hypothetical protein Aduo_003084 [Ancylostoma duodenale]
MSLQPCFLCGARRTLVSVHNVTDSDRAFSLILLTTLARYNVISLEAALEIYKDSHGKVIRICRDHFTEASSYIGSEVEQLWPEFSSDGLSGAPDSVVSALLAHIRMYATMLDDEMDLDVSNVLSFYNKLVSRHYNGTSGNMVPVQMQQVRRFQDASSRPSTSWSSVQAPAGGFEEEATEERSPSPEEFCAEIILEDSPFLTTWSGKLLCSFCEHRFPERKLRQASDNPEQNVIFLSCLVMDKTIDVDVALRIWKEISHGYHKLICKHHYVKAVWSLGEEVRRMWNKYPVHGLQQVPAYMQNDLRRRIQTFADKFYCGTKLSMRDLWSFYDFCQSFYECAFESGANSHVAVESSDKRLLNIQNQSATNHSSKQPHGAPKEQSSSRSVVNEPSSDETVNQEAPKIRICRVCYHVRTEEQVRTSSQYRDQNIVLLSCLVLCGEIDVEQAKESYLETLLKRKSICQRHYVRAVEYLRTEVNRISCAYPTPQFRSVPWRAVTGITKSIQQCCAAIDKNFQVSKDSVRQFYIDCYAKYHAAMGWNDEDKRRSTRKASQEAVPTNSDSNKVALAEGLKRGSKRPGSPLDEENTTESCKVKKNESEEGSACNESSATSTCGSSTSGGDATATSSQDDIVVLNEDTDTDNKRSEFLMVNESNDEKNIASFLLNNYIPTNTCTKEPSTSDVVQPDTCTLCGASGPAINPINLQAASVEPQHNIVLLSFLLMQNLVDFGRAVAFYKRTQCAHAMVCKGHYTKAAARLALDIKKGYEKCRLGGKDETLQQLDYVLNIVVLYRDLIDANVDLQRSHIQKFFDECLEKFWFKNRWTQYKQEKGRRRVNKTEKQKQHVSSYAPCDDHSYTLSACRHLTTQYKNIGESWQFCSNTSEPVMETVDSSSSDDCLPLFDDEKDQKPSISEEISAMDLIEEVESTEEHFTEGSSSEKNQENSTTDPQETHEELSNDVQVDEKDHLISYSDDNLPSTSTELFLDTNTEIKVEMEDEHEILEESAEQNRTPPRDEESIIKSLMEADPTKSISELARELKISSKAVVSYLHNSSASTEKEVGRWVPDERTLQCRVEICSSLLLRNIRDPFLDRIVVYGEKWIYFENRKRATVWLDDAVPICSESAGGQSGEKVLLTMWWTSIGMIHYQFVHGGRPMSDDKFLRMITNMYRKLECKQPGLVSELDVKGLFLLCDNPRPYTSLKSTLRLHQYRFEVLPHPPQSPDLLPSNYHVFRHLNCDLAGKNFYTEAEVERAFLSFIASRKPEFFSDGLAELALRWRKCVSSKGGYFNKS